jgi:uncharacterized protein YbaR (Trm112 family)
MERGLLEVLCCPVCHGELGWVSNDGEPVVSNGTLACQGCGKQYLLEVGLPVLGDRENMARICDRWEEGMLGPERYRRNLSNSREWYDEQREFAEFVDTAASVEGFIADIACGPGASFSGALAPRLSAGAHLIMTDAALHMLHGLKAVWREEPHAAKLDFVACDATHLPFRDGSLDALTSSSGFDCVNDDPTRSTFPGAGAAYREGYRVLKPGGLVCNVSRVYGDDSATAAHLKSLGCANASRESLAECWEALGLDIVREAYLSTHRGKSNPGDGLPLDESDEWHFMAWVLRKR